MRAHAGRLATLCLVVGITAGCASTAATNFPGDVDPAAHPGVSVDAAPLGPAPLGTAPAGLLAPAPVSAPGSAPADLLGPGVEDRIRQARATAAARGADVSIGLLDRLDNRYLGVADAESAETASVAKLFIADSLSYRESVGELALDDDDRDLIGRMLEQSDDDAANVLWAEYGDTAMIDDVAERYRLPSTAAPYDGNWWNTETTVSDLVDYYAGLLDGRGGLDEAHREAIVAHLRSATNESADGYDQRFGLTDGLPGQADLAVKQGWMCCVAGRWIHLTTGVVGPDGRYVLVLISREQVTYEGARLANWDGGGDGPADLDEGQTPYPDTSLTNAADDASAAHARETLTEVVRILFPDGRIG
ncbi:hypothetical protein [Rhodococcus kronopolitis]|uniref:Lipoprotein n=1 Tax=Rhodococcus kronopolitis TaxID=1460226 RepID=A0ABV9FLY4_9NOCA